jgi:hypothetical protein
MKGWAVAGAIWGSALLVTSCGGSIAPASPSSVGQQTLQQICDADPSNALCAPVTNAPATAPPSTPTPNNLEGPVGTVFTDTDSNNDEMDITLTTLVDPAHGTDEFDQPTNGNYFVAAEFLLLGVSGTSSDDANSDATLIGSDGQTYTADFDDVRACTNFDDGEYTVAPGQKSVGCVVFQIPNAVKPAQVEWGGEFGGTPAIWDVG